MKKSEAILQIEEIIDSLQESIKELKREKEKTVKVYSNTDNGGYSDDSSEVDQISFSLEIYYEDDEKETGLSIGLCLVV